MIFTLGLTARPLASASPLAPAQVLTPAATDSLLSVLKERVDKYKKTPGIVVGLVSDRGTQIVAWGKPGEKSKAALDGATLFEIGSITKVFTSLVLADMVEKGELSLADSVRKFLPEAVRMHAGITLYQLATHTSGLPRIPANMLGADEKNPYAAYTADKLYAFLDSYAPSDSTLKNYSYSNLGFGLLGHVLSLRAGKNYEDLVVSRVCDPLGLSSTRITLTPELSGRLAPGHDAGGKAVPNWDFDALAGCGALRSSADDLLRFLAANMGLSDSPLAAAMRLTHLPREKAGLENMRIGLGWHIRSQEGTQVVWHNGGTAGYRSFIGFVEARRLGVVVLTNGFYEIDEIGLHLLDPAIALAPLDKPREIVLDPKVLEKYAGYYQLQPGVVFDIAFQDGRLTAQLTGQPRLTIYPESETVFYYKEVAARLEFKVDRTGAVTGLVLYQNSLQLSAPRLGPDYTPPAAPVTISLEPEVMKQYEGEYQLTPEMKLKVFLLGDKLFVQATGQGPGEITPTSETEFVNAEAGARFVFRKDGQGNVTGLVLYQAGMELPAPKIK